MRFDVMSVFEINYVVRVQADVSLAYFKLADNVYFSNNKDRYKIK